MIRKIHYDENGDLSYYYLLVCTTILLLIVTIYLFFNQFNTMIFDEDFINTEECERKKQLLSNKQTTFKTKFLLFLLLILWCILIKCFVQVSITEEKDSIQNPYMILNITEDTDLRDIKKAYRALVVKYHPDKSTGDVDRFVSIQKAYKVFTEKDAKRLWEEHGIIEGTQMLKLGIALPSWILHSYYSKYAIGVYFACFLVVFPLAVMKWQKSTEEVSTLTIKRLFHFFSKTQKIHMKRIIMILSGNIELKRPTKPSDKLIDYIEKHLDNVGIHNPEPPFCYYYAVKARVLIHAHLSRFLIDRNEHRQLHDDLCYIIRKCPILLKAMVDCVSTLCLYSNENSFKIEKPERKTKQAAKKVKKFSCVETLENIMKLCPMVIQSLGEYKNPLLQLPHISENNLKYLRVRNKPLKSLRDLEREQLSRYLTEDKIDEVLKIASLMPQIEISVHCEVVGEEEPNRFTTDDIISVSINLKRRNLSDLWNKGMNENVDGEEAKENVHGFERVLRKAHKTTVPSVYCPYFPSRVQEKWWVYIINKKEQSLITFPSLVSSLIDEETVIHKVKAPSSSGVFEITVCVRCYCYLGCDQTQDVKLLITNTCENTEMSQGERSNEEDNEDENISTCSTEEEI